MSDELLLFEDKPSSKSEFKPHQWGHWQDESTIPVSDGVEWRTNGFGGHDLIVDDDVTLGYVKRVTTYKIELNDFEVYFVGFALVFNVTSRTTKIEDLGRCQTAVEARQRVLRWLDENRPGWRN